MDLDWHKLANILVEKYKNTNKVNIYCYACSEGAEPLSLAMLLIEKLGKEEAQKFFPIIASDIDEEIFKNAQNGIIKLSKWDIDNIKRILGDNYSKYIEFDNNFKKDPNLNDEVCTGRIKSILDGTVIFNGNVDIRKSITNIEKNNSVVLCRNFWPYIPEKDQSQLAKDLFEQLGENSMCVIGSYDIRKANAGLTLLHKNFKKYDNTCDENCLFYVKDTSKEKKTLSNPFFLKYVYAVNK